MKPVRTLASTIPLVWMLPSSVAAAEATIADTAKALTGLDLSGGGASLRAIALLTVVSVVPSFVLLATSYPRILVVLSFLRRALGAHDLPPNPVLAGLALLLTGIVMAPVWKRVHDDAYMPLCRGEIQTAEEALARASVPLKRFMLSHTLQRDLKLFLELSESQNATQPAGKGTAGASTNVAPQNVEELGLEIVLPAFVLSELKIAFQMGFLIFLPFLVIDLAVSAVLVSMGMFLMPPAMISLPLKVLVFVLADGWNLVVAQLVAGFQSLN